MRRLAALLLLALPVVAHAQTGQDFNTFVSGLSIASAPYTGNDSIPVVRSGVSQRILANQLALINGSQTLTNKVIDCANNTCTVRLGIDTTGQVTVAEGGTGAATAADARTNLGLAIGSDVEAWSNNLDGWSAKAPYAGTLAITSGKTATFSNTLTFSGTDGSTLNVGAGGTLAGMAYQAPSAVAITGGTINGTTIGATTPSTIAATTLAIDSGVISGTGVLSVGADASAGYTPGSALAMVTAIGDNNGIIGQVRNNVPYATTPFLPVGVTGYGQVPSGVASVALGLYGLGELKNSDGQVVGIEATAGMLGGGAAQAGPIPSFGDPINNAIVDGEHITCRSQTGTGATGNCSLGLFISNENAGDTSKPVFNTGETIFGFSNIGLYIDPNQTTGSQVTAQFNNNGNSINLVLKTTAAAQVGNAVIEVQDSSGTPEFVVRQNGDVDANFVVAASGYYAGASAGITSATCSQFTQGICTAP